MCLCTRSLEAETFIFSLKGYLGKDELADAKKTIQLANQSNSPLLAIEINSSSGSINEVLAFARELYSLKAKKKARIFIFINDNALGPAAILPFLADELFISYIVSWGDIPLGAEDKPPANILRNQVKSLIPSNNRNIGILTVIAESMSDPSLQVVDDNGWRVAQGNFPKVISPAGETLVLNQNQLEQLGLVSEVVTQEAFHTRFAPLTLQQQPSVAEPEPLQELNAKLKKYINFNLTGENKVGLIEINNKESSISQSTWIYVKNALDYYKKTKPILVILELNTPGGEVYAAQKISDALKDLDTQENIPVIAFINNWAISAGAMLAYSSRFIAVTKDASMGAAEPVLVGETGQMVSASEKVNSALRADFANRASFFDRNPAIAEAMVDKDVILVLRRGKIIKVDNEAQIKSTGPDPDIIVSPKGKLLTLNTEELIRYGVADILLSPAKVKLISAEEKSKEEWPASKMLLFQYPYFQQIPNAIVDFYQMDWKTQFLVLLASPMVSSLLFLGLVLGVYMEMSTPGVGLPGSIALICLFLIILSSFALELANVLEFVLLFAGLLFVLVDVFFLPTFGMLGIVGVILFLIGLFGMMLPGIGSIDFEFNTKTFNAAGEAFMQRLAWLSGTLILALIIISVLARYIMPTFGGFQRFVLSGHEQQSSNGFIAGVDPHLLPKPGSKGVVFATLRPAGKVLIGGEIYDAVSDGDFIEKHTPIVVVKLDGSV
ncbi:MAG TPA: NfeD family protein, partial [Waddliaceae bacterium]